ncbi:60Kd inner membrane protein-domain-containing protein [Colletotrichum navitas]|uniref:60Kd inner membrane protein-domain-containing protein n=1 Tax=Colletotrichum navitas TaxID=681940 RepID=A0AAD8PQZ1_9PEZI|nr:60Kd inner membrane protein-domain-containing protein [Colletotrichum navitas]KAK1574637.1 60Kd inner membrane protein-domain-containing protein [Colletotrichum navitas]
MLPSRGVLRSLPSVRATSSISSQSMSRSPRRLGDGRQFGTSLRSSGAPWTALRPANSRLGSGLAGTIAIGGSLETRRALSLWYSKPEPAPAETTPTSAAPAQTSVESAAAATDDAFASAPVPEPVLADAVTPSSSIPELDAAALLDLPEQIGFLKTLGLDFGWGPSSVMQWVFEHIHVYSGLPWWASIAATGILLRLVMFKPLLRAQDTSARMQKLHQDPKYEEVRKGLQEAMSRGDSAAMTELRRDLSVMNKNAGVNPLNGLWGLLQIPFGYGMFRVLNGAAAIPVPGMETGGFLWFSDLTVADPLFLLPIAGPIAMFAMVKLGSRYATPQAKAQQKLMMYILGPISVIFTAFLPAGVQWYFFVAGAVGVFQNWLFNMAGFRKFFGLMPLSAPAAATITTAAANSGPTYQPPRGAAKTSAQDGSISGIINSLKQTVHDAKGGAGNYMEANRAKDEAQHAKKYAERRGEQERQKFWSEMRKK